ncbi:MAG: aminotransferase class I/II-fold pyridoxal phosphate-dependent enzyme, partial [Cyanobacteria bacterium]|nr:aminotransferase class I/II-fold pyridoxal phosphate-dependent enzyme [Cyanobacteriota bacterium]
MQWPSFRLERYFSLYEREGISHLSASGFQPFTLEAILSLSPSSREKFEKLSLGYPETRGVETLRDIISHQYPGIAPHQVSIHSGSAEGIFTFMASLFGPGDHLIVHYPVYQSLYSVAQAQGAEISFWEARSENNWHLNLDALPQLLQPHTKAVVVNFPHNPSGALMSQSDWLALVEFCRNHGLILFSDEVYRHLEYDPTQCLPPACQVYERGVSLGGLSKAYGLPGLRVGWVATQDDKILTEMAKLRDYTTICASATNQFLACLALQHQDSLFALTRPVMQDNLLHLTQFMEQFSNLLDWVPPQAGVVCFPRWKGSGSVDDLAHRLMEKQQVLILPGKYCYQESLSLEDALSNSTLEGARHFRIGFGNQDFSQSLKKMAQVLAS